MSNPFTKKSWSPYLLGAGLFVVAYDWLQPLINWGDYGEITLFGATDTSPWLWIVLIAAAGLVAAWLAERGHREGGHGTVAAPEESSTTPS
jgi:H+/Cl- antiporter ClcA